MALLAGKDASRCHVANYGRHDPTQTLFFRLVEQHYPVFSNWMSEHDRTLPNFVAHEFDAFIACGRLENGFVRVRCERCQHQRLVAFSCKRRGFCSSCGARRMAEASVFLSEQLFPKAPRRQWVPHRNATCSSVKRASSF